MLNNENTKMLVIFLVGIAVCMFFICNKKEHFQTEKPMGLRQCSLNHIKDKTKVNNIFNNCKPIYDYEMNNLYNNDGDALLKCVQCEGGMNNKELDDYKNKCHDSFIYDKKLNQSNNLLNCTKNYFQDNKINNFNKVMKECKPVYNYELNNTNDTEDQGIALSRCVQCTGNLTDKQHLEFRNKCKNAFFKDKAQHLKGKHNFFHNIHQYS